MIVRKRGEPPEYVTGHYGSPLPFFQAAARDGGAAPVRPDRPATRLPQGFR